MSVTGPNAMSATAQRREETASQQLAPARAFLDTLVASAVIHPEDWHALPEMTKQQFQQSGSRDALVQHLVDLKLLNRYQADRAHAQGVHALVLGNYRILGRIQTPDPDGVFAAEHIHMRRAVVIKTLTLKTAQEPDRLARLLREIRAVAAIDHPNIVAMIDAGVLPGTTGQPDLYFFVMEHLVGIDLERQVTTGPVPVRKACTWAFQIASALDAAHRRNLVHGSVKPSSIFITRDGIAKLLDFGFAWHEAETLTTTSDLVRALDFMAPEQVHGLARRDIRSDIFGLGATLYFALVGKSPFAAGGDLQSMLEKRHAEHLPRASSLGMEIPENLDGLLVNMMATSPEARLQTPQAAMRALLPFLETPSQIMARKHGPAHHDPLLPAFTGACVLLVDHDATLRQRAARVLTANGLECLEAENAEQAVPLLRAYVIQAILIGADTPDTHAGDLLKHLHDLPTRASLKALMMSAHKSDDELLNYLSQGASDCISFPINDVQLVARVRAAVRHKEAQDHLDRLNQQLLDLNMELERALTTKASDLIQARNSLVMALARLVEYRSTETIAHLSRMQRYCVILAHEVAAHPLLANQIDPEFVQTLECAAPLHDIGNIGLPDAILLKPGPLDADERRIMQTHPVIGAETLQHIAHRLQTGNGFMRMAIDIARFHHEHFDGTGYPDGLAGNDIPLAARIVALADTYDSLRSRRAQRPRLSHAAAVQIMMEASPGKFDPIILAAFHRCAMRLDRVYTEVPDNLLAD